MSKHSSKYSIWRTYLYFVFRFLKETISLLRRTTQRQLTKVNFDIESQDFDDAKIIESTLRSAVQNGVIGSFYVESEGFTFRVVEGKSICAVFLLVTRFDLVLICRFRMGWSPVGSAISPLPTPDPEVCEVTCKSDGLCITFNQRCDYFNDCEDGSDEEGCRKSLICLPSSLVFCFFPIFLFRDRPTHAPVTIVGVEMAFLGRGGSLDHFPPFSSPLKPFLLFSVILFYAWV